MTNPLAQDLGGVVLLPCPFCGGKGAFASEMFNGDWRVSCGVCTAQSSGEASEEEAITAWNTRAHSAEIAGALRDAERWRWIRDGKNPIDSLFSEGSDECTEMYSGVTLDTAIDSAMQQGGGGGDHA